MEEQIYDVIVIGMGPAGISAAIYANRSGLNTLILENSAPGGMINYTGLINNYPGIADISGPDLAYKLFEHVNHLQIPYKLEGVEKIAIEKDLKIVKTKRNTYKTKTVIVATGRAHRKMNLANTRDLEGKGISYCAICDGPLFKNKQVVVVGGGNSALGQTLFLANLCERVTVLNRSNNLRASQTLQDKIKELTNVDVLLDTQIVEVVAEKDKLKSVILDNGEEIDTDGLFVYIGFDPATEFVKDLNITNEYGYIKVNDKFGTDIEGLFACGDCIIKDLYQIATSVGEGASAGISAFEYLQGQ